MVDRMSPSHFKTGHYPPLEAIASRILKAHQCSLNNFLTGLTPCYFLNDRPEDTEIEGWNRPVDSRCRFPLPCNSEMLDGA
jgi:hypothetical protein